MMVWSNAGAPVAFASVPESSLALSVTVTTHARDAMVAGELERLRRVPAVDDRRLQQTDAGSTCRPLDRTLSDVKLPSASIWADGGPE